MALKVRGGIYVVEWFPGGKRDRKSTGIRTDEPDAKQRAESFEREYCYKMEQQLVRLGGKLAHTKAGLLTFGQYLDAEILAIESRGLNSGYVGWMKYAKEELVTFFGVATLAKQISMAQIHAYIAARRKEVKGQTVTREVRLLKGYMLTAYEQGELASVPVRWPKIKRDPKDKKRRGKFVPFEVLLRWLPLLPQDTREFAEFVLLTGIRRDEMRRLRYDMIVDGMLDLPDEESKAGGGKIPLHKHAQKIVQLRRERYPNAERIFPVTNTNSNDEMQEQFTAAAMKVWGMPITARDLRHTVGSRLAKFDPVATMEVLRHKDLSMTAEYTTAEGVAETIQRGLGELFEHKLLPQFTATVSQPLLPAPEILRENTRVLVGAAGFEPTTSCSQSQIVDSIEISRHVTTCKDCARVVAQHMQQSREIPPDCHTTVTVGTVQVSLNRENILKRTRVVFPLAVTHELGKTT
jgi:integrase